MEDQRPGAVAWVDLTVPEAEPVRDFYREVVGWEPSPVDMGGYDDFTMNLPGTDVAAAGVCHARGGNAGIPPQWLMYVTVANLDASLARATALGGEIVKPAVVMSGQGRFAIVRDPAGAVCALFEKA